MRNLIIGGVILIIILFAVSISNSTHVEEYKDVKVLKLEQQSLMKGDKESIRTEIRYLVITNKGTFVCESNAFEGKFNNSDIFYRLEEGKTYPKIKVSGYGKGFFYDYQNIIEVEGLE